MEYHYRLRHAIEAHQQEVVAFCHCGEGRFATSSLDRKIKLWELNDQGLPELRSTFHCVDAATALCWVPVSEAYPSGGIAAGGSGTQVFIWNLSTHESYAATNGAHLHGVTGIVLDSEHNLITSAPDGRIRRFDNAGRVTADWIVHNGPIRSIVRFDQGRILTGSSDRTLKIWHENTGQVMETYEGHQGSVQAIAVGAGTVISGSFDGTIRSWDSEGAHNIVSERPISNKCGINGINFHPQSANVFAVGSRDGSVKIWHLTGGQLFDMKHPGSVMMLTFLADGTLVSGCSNGKMYIWTTNHVHIDLNVQEYNAQCETHALKFGRVKLIGGADILAYTRKGLGSGGFSSVVKGKIPRHNPYGLLDKEVAIKFARGRQPIPAGIQLENEIRILESVELTDNITHMLGHGETPDGVKFVALELASTDLSLYLKEGHSKFALFRKPSLRDLTWQRIWSIIKDISRALEFLHEKNIRHGDIKPANILLMHQKKTSVWKAKLADFGISCICDPMDPPPYDGRFTAGYLDPMTTRRGDDTYSFGIVALQLLTGEINPLEVRDRDLAANLVTKKDDWMDRLSSLGCKYPAAVFDLFLDLTAESPVEDYPPRKGIADVCATLALLDAAV